LQTSDILGTAFYAAGAGAAVLAALSLAGRVPRAPAYFAGAGFFALAAAVSLSNLYWSAHSEAPLWASELLGSLVVGLFALLWLYLRDLSSETPRPFRGADAWHAAIPAAKALLAMMSAAMPASYALALQTHGPSDTLGIVYGLSSFATTIAVLFFPLYYLGRIAWVLWRIPVQLKQAFADLSGRRLIWMRAVAILALMNAVLSILVSVEAVVVPESVFGALALVQILTMGIWAVNQSPIFAQRGAGEERFSPPEPEAETSPPGTAANDDDKPGKYERSLLPDERLDRIAARIEAVFRDKRLHLEPNVSLATLAQATGVAPNALSQTFSRRLGATFFDYVNRWRVEEAKRLLETSEEAVARVAYESGFNSRSAFYNAFREATGMTPAAYRTAQR
jgi:AraC-like DNA-binding protein